MDYNYPIVSGEAIAFEQLSITRAKNLALVILKHPSCIEDSVSYRKREDNSEIILVTFDNEIPQFPLNGIKVYEDVAIVCHSKDLNFPEVYALRDNFNKNLPHTNITPFEYPTSLCVTEQYYHEIRHKFNEFEFIDNIARWFSLTSNDTLHQDDQPLEPFFNIKGGVIIPEYYNGNMYGFLNQIDQSSLFIFNNEPSGSVPYRVIGFEADPQVHGFIRKTPQTLGDLSEVIKIKGNPLSNYIKNIFDIEIKSGLPNKEIFQLNNVFYCTVPVKRNKNDKEPASINHFFIRTDKNFLQVGIDSNCLDKSDDRILPIIGNKFDLNTINNIKINLLFPLNDFNTSTASLYNNIPENKDSYVLIGAGALGSQFFETISRMGFGNWTIVDDDILYPHNLAKHSLGRESLGFNKAIKVVEKSNILLNSDINKAISKNFLAVQNDKEFVEKLQKSKYIIDMSTSIAVARALARDYKEEVKTPRISSFLNPMGTDLVVIAEDNKRKFRLDFLEMQYYRYLVNQTELNNHLKFEETQKIRYNRNSCREITNRINQTDVALLASISAKSIKKIIEEGKPIIFISRINNDTFEVNNFSLSPSKWIRYNRDGWKIYLDTWLFKKIQSFRNEKLPNETGGILIGSYDSYRKIIYICDTIKAPSDSLETQNSFIRGQNDLIDKYNSYVDITDNQLEYIGEWHSHPPQCCAIPSKDDDNLYSYLHTRMSKQGLPVLMGILGDKNCNIIFKENSYEV